MAIISNAGQTGLAIFNKPTATPPIIFSDYTDNSHFSYCIWARVIDNTTPEALISYQGTNGSRLLISAQKGYWLFELRDESFVFQQVSINSMIVDNWIAFCVVVDNYNIKVYSGHGSIANSPVSLALSVNLGFLNRFTFAHIAMVTSHNMAICNFRYFDIALDPSEIDIHVNRWAVNGPKIPKWSSPLRVPGDISNVVGVYTSPDWASGHAFDVISPSISNLLFYTPDPEWMAISEPCPTWLYLHPGLGQFLGVNPGTTPTVPTTYPDNTNFFFFEDRGTIAIGAIQTVYYCAYPNITGTGPGPSSSWPIFHNANGVDVPIDFGDPNMRFEVDTSVLAPTSITSPSIYLWKFGGQFTYQPPAGIPTATGLVGYPYLYVVYIGVPPGVPTIITVDNLSGLFAIKKGQLTDQYNLGTIVKIPDPTIRTALIGE